MNPSASAILAVLLTAAASPSAALGEATVPASGSAHVTLGKSIKRFVQVDERLFRGEEPDQADLVALRDLGVRTVISFRTDDSERALVEGLGMTFVHIPIALNPLSFGIRLRRSAVDDFFKVVDNPASGIVFVHCRRGADRTGAFVGLYRIARQQWDPGDAYREARDIGMRWWYFGVEEQFRRFAAADAF
jgi:protein tyrosine phosphatase (PTP) superfamily phosphohydrolase (DUF442 family)